VPFSHTNDRGVFQHGLLLDRSSMTNWRNAATGHNFSLLIEVAEILTAPRPGAPRGATCRRVEGDSSQLTKTGAPDDYDDPSSSAHDRGHDDLNSIASTQQSCGVAKF
jgi:hypothetical protein